MKTRGFEKLHDGATMPTRATKNSAGYDIYAQNSYIVMPNEVVKVCTGICAYMQSDEYLAIFIRSSLAIKKRIVLANGVGIIDADYYHNIDNMGEIIVAVKNEGSEPVEIKKGDRIAQGIFMKYLLADKDCAETIRTGGIGSTLR